MRKRRRGSRARNLTSMIGMREQASSYLPFIFFNVHIRMGFGFWVAGGQSCGSQARARNGSGLRLKNLIINDGFDTERKKRRGGLIKLSPPPPNSKTSWL